MICIVDFDGTLFKNDFFEENFFKNLIDNPFNLLVLLFKKKFNLLEIKKEVLANFNCKYDVNFLINDDVIAWINKNRSRFTHIFLVSATPDNFLKLILNEQKTFDDIFGSTKINLKGSKKLKFIQQKWNIDFAYIGDSNADIPIFKVAKESYKVINNKVINVKTIF
jgi:hydroxymethylpyrimidine pyrophosphatase-like HAD family hydrolase